MNEIDDPIKIVVADAQFLCRVGICSIIDKHDGFEVVGEAVDEEDLIEEVMAHHPDVIIIDYDQPEFFVAAVVEKIKQRSPRSEILIISSDNNKDRITSVLASGVNSFLTKQCEESEIVNAIKSTARKEKFFCNKILDLLVERSFPSKNEECSPTPLTAREKEILTMVAEGKIAKEIAAELHLSPHTVYTHRKNIMKKLNLTSPTEMVVHAIQLGLIQVD